MLYNKENLETYMINEYNMGDRVVLPSDNWLALLGLQMRVDRREMVKKLSADTVTFFSSRIVVYNKENLERQEETNKYGRGTERHLPKTNESVVRPAGERH